MRRKCDISSGPRSGGLATMIADPKKSESKAKTLAGQLPNCLPMRDSALGPTLVGSCTEVRCSISLPRHEIALFEIRAALTQGRSVKRANGSLRRSSVEAEP